MHSDIAEALDEGSTISLIMLNLSAAFDVIDLPIMLKYVMRLLGPTGSASDHRSLPQIVFYFQCYAYDDDDDDNDCFTDTFVHKVG